MDILKVEFKIKIPSWVEWIAIDANGECFGYEKEPVDDIASEWWGVRTGRYKALYKDTPPKNWKDELYTWS